MAEQESQPENESTPLEQFVEHEKTAFIEAGRALASLVPVGLRKHGWNAIEETAKGFGVLAGAVKDSAEEVIKTAKDEIILPKEDGDNNTSADA